MSDGQTHTDKHAEAETLGVVPCGCDGGWTMETTELRMGYRYTHVVCPICNGTGYLSMAGTARAQEQELLPVCGIPRSMFGTPGTYAAEKARR